MWYTRYGTMMKKYSQDPYKVCKAMKDAGIKDPTSQAGIDFCTDECPYDRCVIFEPERGRPASGTELSDMRRDIIVDMLTNGYSPIQAAIRTGISIRTVEKINECLDKQNKTEG